MAPRTPRAAKRSCDSMFSKWIRHRDNYTCRRCGVKKQTVQCAHLVSRRYAITRCDPDNAVTLCPACHILVDQTWHIKQQLVDDTIGRQLYDKLWSRAMGHKGKPFDWIAEWYIWVSKMELIR